MAEGMVEGGREGEGEEGERLGVLSTCSHSCAARSLSE